MTKYVDQYSGFKWIKVKQAKLFVLDGEKYVPEKHHVTETSFLIEEIHKLARLLDESTETKSGPISPNDLCKLKRQSIPDKVIDSFNELIVKNWNNDCAVVSQKNVVDLISKKEGFGVNRSRIFKEGWLNIEEVFAEAGWQVSYSSSDYTSGESDAFWKFSK